MTENRMFWQGLCLLALWGGGLGVWIAAQPTTPPTIYVALNEPGASNTACDGLAPTDEGDGRCPYKDFLSAHTFRLLWNKPGVRVEVRKGVYDMSPAGEGLTLNGAGQNDNELTVLTNYHDESVIFDGGNTLREVIRMSGSYVVLRGIQVQRAGAYNVESRGGGPHLIDDVVIAENFRSDALKIAGGAVDVVVQDSEFYGWQSQAIDATEVVGLVIQRNNFHDAGVLGTRALGFKFGLRDALVENNRFDGLGVAFGGGSTAHPEPYEARDIVFRNNVMTNITSKEAIRFYSCWRCAVIGNRISGTYQIGILLANDDYAGSSGCADGMGCSPNRRIRVRRNTLTGSPVVQIGAWASEVSGFRANRNRYCGGGMFYYDGEMLDLQGWQRVTRQDRRSTVC